MAGTGLATAHLTQPVLPLSPRFERGARTQARTYAHGRTLHSPGWRHSRLFKFHSSFIDFYIRLFCIVTFGRKIVGQLEEERRQREDTIEAERQRMEQRMEERMQAERQSMAQYMQTLFQNMGLPTPLMPFPSPSPAPPPAAGTPVSHLTTL